MKPALKINSADNVAVALQTLKEGEKSHIGGEDITLKSDIPAGHKIALRDFHEGDTVIKYGFPIGHAIHDVHKGSLLDHHDIHSNLKGELNYDNVRIKEPCRPQPACDTTFMGYRRSDGQAGIRNELWVIPTVGCVNGTIRQIIERVKEKTNGGPGVDDIVDFPHNYGCSQLGTDMENTRKILRALVHHPNAGGVLVVGLGCENNQPREFEKFCGDYAPERVKFMVCQDVKGDEVETGAKLLTNLYETARHDIRTETPASALRIGLKCGGSDGFSGITANPLLGAFSDWLCERQGGSTVLTEVPEMFGAETLLMERCLNTDLLHQTQQLINDFKRYFLSHGQPVGENPSPGNKAGGISTLEEKALGCTQKSGHSPVCGVIPYAGRLQAHGLNLLSAPGNDLVASTALAAAGCQMILFTTGRGTPFGTCVPTLKISSNAPLYERKPGWIDFNAGCLLEDMTIDELLPDFIQFILNVANGQKVNAEQNNIRGIAIFKDGVTL